jgi:hypothetical protein
MTYDLPLRYVVQHQNDIEFPLRDTKSNLFGVPTGRKGAFQGFFNVMLMW